MAHLFTFVQLVVRWRVAGCPTFAQATLSTGDVQAKEHEAKLRHIMETVPIKIDNVMGSSAGAGSGEFHTYRKVRLKHVLLG